VLTISELLGSVSEAQCNRLGLEAAKAVVGIPIWTIRNR
jgi:hypothetical protein